MAVLGPVHRAGNGRGLPPTHRRLIGMLVFFLLVVSFGTTLKRWMARQAQAQYQQGQQLHTVSHITTNSLSSRITVKRPWMKTVRLNLTVSRAREDRDSKFCPARRPRVDAPQSLVKAHKNPFGYKRWQHRYSWESYPKVVEGNHGRFIMCTIPKNGCSQWKRLILKAMGKPRWFYLDEKTSHLTIHGTRYRYLPKIPRAKMTAALADENANRVAIVRNPFTRVLSSYLNKIVKANDRRRYREKLALDQWSDWVTFKEYIAALRQWKTEREEGLRLSSNIDHHFALQSSFCGLPMDRESWLHWDYILKIELINDWYPCMVKKLNISSLVDLGWPDDNKCFFNSPGRPCDGQSMEGGFSQNKWDAGDHATSASSRLREYYDEETEAEVADLYREDFEFFGYHTRLAQSTKADLGFEYQPKVPESGRRVYSEV